MDVDDVFDMTLERFSKWVDFFKRRKEAEAAANNQSAPSTPSAKPNGRIQGKQDKTSMSLASSPFAAVLNRQ